MIEEQASRRIPWRATGLVLAIVLLCAGAGVAVGQTGNAPDRAESTPRQIDDLDSYIAERYSPRVRVEGPAGLSGWADRDKVLSRPEQSANPEQAQARFEAWLGELVPVTRAEDPTSEVIGYWAQNYGLIDRDTVNAPGFDLRALQAQEQARLDEAAQEISKQH